MSCDVIFNEGTGHRIKPILNDDTDGDLLLVTNTASIDGGEAVLTPRQPIVPHIRSTDQPLHPTSLTRPDTEPLGPNPTNSTMATQDPAPIPPAAPVIVLLRRSERLRAAEAQQSTRTVPPQSFLAYDVYSYLTLLNELNENDAYVPRSYTEAMRRPDLWLPAIRTKLEMMDQQGVFRLVPKGSVPAGKKVIGCRWVFANKYDAEGNITKRKA